MNSSLAWKLLPSLAALALGGCAVDAGAPSDPAAAGDEPTASTSQAVESQYQGPGTYQVDITPPSTNALLAATGVLYAPLNHDNGTPWTGTDGSPMRATCGVTFISPHYAVTAAHCVDGTDLPSTSMMFPVDQMDVSAASWSTITASENETGSYFTYFPSYTFAQLTATQGYKVTRYNQCHVAARCSYDNVNCSDNADVALIRCDDRSWFSPSIAVASSDAQTGDVGMEWYHEVYSSMPITAPVPSTGFGNFAYWHNEDRWQHYTQYPPLATGEADQYAWNQNFHYYGGTKNQLLPLQAATYKDGDLFFGPSRLGYDSSSQVVWTDLYGCHGTSGSGIVQWVLSGSTYVPQLLGPTVQGSAQSGLSSNLCDTMSGMQGWRVPQLGYPALSHTQGIAALAAGDTRWHVLTTTTSAPAAAEVEVAHAYAGPPAHGFPLK